MTQISIIIRTHNEEKWITQSIRKVRRQSVDDIEIILVDNNSTDKTVPKARNTHPELTLVEIDDYMPGLAINEGIRASTGEYVVCLSAHCVPVDDQWLEHLRRNFDQETDVAGVYGRQVPAESSDPTDKRDLIRMFGLERQIQERDTFFHNANSMIRRDVWEEYPFNEGVTNIEDQIWGNEVINAGYKLVYEPEAAVYHHHGINQGNDNHRTRSVVRTMENNEIQPDTMLDDDLHGKPFDPEELDIVSFVPVRRKTDFGVDFNDDLIVQTIDHAHNSNYINEVFLLTDSESLANKADQWDAKAPFVRPEGLSARDVPVIEVLQYALKQIEERNQFPDVIVPIEITHPFRPPDLLDNLIDKLISNGYDSVVASYPEYRPCWLQTDQSLERINKDTHYRVDREPVQIGLPSLGCATYPQQIRRCQRFGDDIGIYEIDDPISMVEIREQADLNYWQRVKEIDDLF